jgi:hypothetical protein
VPQFGKVGLPRYIVVIDGRSLTVLTAANAAKMIAKARAELRSVSYEIVGVSEQRKAGLDSNLQLKIEREING